MSKEDLLRRFKETETGKEPYLWSRDLNKLEETELEQVVDAAEKIATIIPSDRIGLRHWAESMIKAIRQGSHYNSSGEAMMRYAEHLGNFATFNDEQKQVLRDIAQRYADSKKDK